jgi:hypothetical protein
MLTRDWQELVAIAAVALAVAVIARWLWRGGKC